MYRAEVPLPTGTESVRMNIIHCVARGCGICLIASVTVLPQSSYLSNELSEACRTGDFGRAMALINDVADVNGLTADSLTPLIVSAMEGQFSGVMFLVMHKADVNRRAAGSSGITPLIAGIRSGDERIVRFLVMKGADVNIADTKGMTPLMAAAEGGNEQIVGLLLKKGAYIEGRKPPAKKDAKDTKAGKAEEPVQPKVTPLMYAVVQGHVPVIRLLIEQGADINCRDSLQRTPLMLAAMIGDMELVRLLIDKGADLTAKDARGRTAVDYAATLASPAILFYLTSLGVRPPKGMHITQCKGLYRCSTPTTAFGSDPHYLWFLRNGSVYAVSTNADSAHLPDIIHTRNPELASGTWTIRGGYLNFSLKPGDQGMLYFSALMGEGDLIDGTLNDGVLNVDVRSTEQWSTFTMVYRFVPLLLYSVIEN